MPINKVEDVPQLVVHEIDELEKEEEIKIEDDDNQNVNMIAE
jgi:hypothetical protein